jgi:hypothetical protein
LSKRGHVHSQKSSHPSIPATPLPSRCDRKSHRFSACDDLSPQQDSSLMADGNEHLTQGLRKRNCLYSHREESLGFTFASSRACFRSRRLCVMHPVTYRIGRCREFRVSVVVVWCRLVVWQFGVECDRAA